VPDIEPQRADSEIGAPWLWRFLVVLRGQKAVEASPHLMRRCTVKDFRNPAFALNPAMG